MAVAGGYEADVSGDLIGPGEGARITYLRPKEMTRSGGRECDLG